MQCPQCGACEEHPTRDDAILVRFGKVFDKYGTWSQCLVCSGFYNDKLEEQPTKHINQKGWFIELDGETTRDGRLRSGPVEVLTREEFHIRKQEFDAQISAARAHKERRAAAVRERLGRNR